MRSRNGSRSLSFTICTLILLPFYLYADSYYIGYRAIVKDALLVDETLNISRAMTPCRGKESTTLSLPALTQNVHTLIKENSDQFYKYLLSLSLHVRHNESVINSQSRSLTTLTFPTHCFTIDFKGNLANITLMSTTLN